MNTNRIINITNILIYFPCRHLVANESLTKQTRRAPPRYANAIRMNREARGTNITPTAPSARTQTEIYNKQLLAPHAIRQSIMRCTTRDRRTPSHFAQCTPTLRYNNKHVYITRMSSGNAERVLECHETLLLDNAPIVSSLCDEHHLESREHKLPPTTQPK